MSSDPKNHFGFIVDEISERGHIIKSLDTSAQTEKKNYFGFT